MPNIRKIVSINLVVILLLLDQYLKYAVRTRFTQEFFLIKSSFLNFSFQYVQNPNLAFSLQLNSVIIIILTAAMTAVLLGILIYAYMREKYSLAFPINFIVMGAISNLYDRLAHGFVIDYIAISVKQVTLSVFNIADVLIIVGILIWMMKTK